MDNGEQPNEREHRQRRRPGESGRRRYRRKGFPDRKYEVHPDGHQCGRQWDVLSERDCESPNARLPR